MANEDEDVRKTQLHIEALRRSQTAEDAPRFVAELQRLVDSDRAAQSSWRDRLSEIPQSIQNWLERKLFRLAYGYERPPLDSEAERYINALHAEGTLSDDEQRICKKLRLPRRADDGLLEVVGPPTKVKWLRWLVVAPVAIAFAYSVTTLLTQFFPIQDVALMGYPLGAAIGTLCRPIYNYTWGWKPLAIKLRYTGPMLRARLK